MRSYSARNAVLCTANVIVASLLLLVSIGTCWARQAVETTAGGATEIDFRERFKRRPVDDLRAIREHLLLADPSDRPYLRFFTFTHLSNNEKVSFDELIQIRFALCKLLNSLSWRSEFCLPLDVANSSGNVLAIDLRQLEWSDGRQWLQIVNHYPYGLKLNYVKDVELKQLANEIEQLSNAEMPVVRGDWFVYAAARSPLYPELLQLPSHISELAATLGVELDANPLESSAVRAGLLQSQVSLQHRMIERHESKFGALWLSYDFAPRQVRSDLVRFPLGPRAPSNPLSAQGFDPAMVLALFHLPNGLQGYFMADAQGNRIDDPAPIEILHDASVTSGTSAVVNGISCISCHRDGVVGGFRDQVRLSAAMTGQAAEAIERLHVAPEQLDKLIRRDQIQFLAALQSISSAKALHQDKQMQSARQVSDLEPIRVATQIYVRDLGPEEVAYELGLLSLDEVRTQILSDKELKRMGLAALLQDVPVGIKRSRWEAIDGTSYFQDVAVELGLGTPLLPGSKRPFSRPVSKVNP